MIPIIWPYKMGSASAKALATELSARRVYSNLRYRPNDNHLIINWGNSQPARWFGTGDGFDWINNPEAVASASDKTQCLRTLFEAGVNTPTFTDRRLTAEEWLRHHQDKSTVFCRQLTRASSGRGIVIANSPEELVPAALYTANVGKRTEYRVHVFNGEVIDFAQKKKMSDERIEEYGIDFSWAIRSHDRGWVFARTDITLPTVIQDVAINSINCLGLDFGAVDCYLTNNGDAGVFEVNTAPGLEGTTLVRYTEAIERML